MLVTLEGAMEEQFKGRLIICRKPFSEERMRVQKRMEEDAREEEEIIAELEKLAKEIMEDEE